MLPQVTRADLDLARASLRSSQHGNTEVSKHAQNAPMKLSGTEQLSNLIKLLAEVKFLTEGMNKQKISLMFT